MPPRRIKGRDWSGARLRGLALQGLALAAALGGVGWLAQNAAFNLADRGIAGGFGFLGRAASFPISESLLRYRPSDSFGWAFVVGLGNTLLISVVAGVGATVLGFGLALIRRSANPIAAGFATVVVDSLRNTPVVVQLLFWYSLFTLALPGLEAALHPAPGVLLSNRGAFLPVVHLRGSGLLGLVALTLAAGGLGVLRLTRRGWYRALAAVALLLAAAGVAFAGGLGLQISSPHRVGSEVVGGLHISPEFAAISVGLVLYSAVYVGEIVRGGIDAVPKGQWEAGRSLGLSEGQTLRLIILPQALRIIIPPMTSQYINIIKNTTLALVVGYPDISLVAATTINQTGQAVEGVAILMLVFLSISLAASVLMNLLNRRFALVQR